MSRLARIALLTALAASLTAPQAFAAAPLDRADAGILGAAQHLLARLWEPVARLFAGSDGGPGKDPDGLTAEGGPTRDPDGVPSTDPGTQGSPPGGGETDGGPGKDPNG